MIDPEFDKAAVKLWCDLEAAGLDAESHILAFAREIRRRGGARAVDERELLKQRIKTLEDAIREIVTEHGEDGNVRYLRWAIEAAVKLVDSGDEVV